MPGHHHHHDDERPQRSFFALRAMSMAAAQRRRKTAISRSETEQRLQIRHHNSKLAVRPDDELVEPGKKRKQIEGPGAWKQFTGQAFLRCAFSSPSSTDSALAKQFQCAKSSVSRVRRPSLT